MNEIAAAECEKLRHEVPPSRHQRRILVLGGAAGEDGKEAGRRRATVLWQRQYVGGVYVSVSGDEGQQLAVVGRFLAAGCCLQATHFYRPADVPALALLARKARKLHPRGGFDPFRAAELLMLGATDVVGPYPARDLWAVRHIAARANRLLGEDWLPRPEQRRAAGVPAAAGTPVRRRTAPGPREIQEAFADTAHALAAECESRLGLLDGLTDHRHDPHHHAVATRPADRPADRPWDRSCVRPRP